MLAAYHKVQTNNALNSNKILIKWQYDKWQIHSAINASNNGFAKPKQVNGFDVSRKNRNQYI